MRISTHEMFPLFEDGKINKQNAMMQAVKSFERHDVDNLTDLYVLLVEEDVVYAPIYWRTNHRKLDNAILNKVDLLIYDSDDGDTDDEILEMFKGTELLLLQTASWTKEHQKYRIFIPLEEPMAFEDPQEYSDFYRWLGDSVQLHYDTQTTECGRGYIGLANKEGTLNKGKKLNKSAEWEIEKLKIQKKRARAELRRKIKEQQMKERLQRSGRANQIWTLPSIRVLPRYINYVDDIKISGKLNRLGYALGHYLLKFGISKTDVIEELVTMRAYYKGNHGDAYDTKYWNRYL